MTQETPAKLMTNEEKITFLQWLVKSNKFNVWYYEANNESVDGKIYLQPKDGNGNSAIVSWNTKLNEVCVQLYEGLCEYAYDFGTIARGEGYIDRFYISYNLVKEEVSALLKMKDYQNQKKLEKRQAELGKVGNAENFSVFKNS